MTQIIEIRHVIDEDGLHCRHCGMLLAHLPVEPGWFADRPVGGEVVAFSPPDNPMSRYPHGPSFDCEDFEPDVPR